MAIRSYFLKDNTNIKPDFCKQYKMRNNNLFINTLDEPRVHLYIDLFARKNILPNIKDYK